MKFFTWRNGPKWIAVAHAESVSKARERLLGEVGGLDGSCVVRAKAREIIAAEAPEIWNGINAEFALTDSAELEEADAENTRLRAAKARLAEALKSVYDWLIDIEGADPDPRIWHPLFVKAHKLTKSALSSTDSLAWLEGEKRKAAAKAVRDFAAEFGKTHFGGEVRDEAEDFAAELERRMLGLEGGRG